MERKLTLVIVTAQARRAGPILAERFPGVRVETGSVLVPVSRPETADSILAYCRERHIDVVGSAIVSRSVYPAAAARLAGAAVLLVLLTGCGSGATAPAVPCVPWNGQPITVRQATVHWGNQADLCIVVQT